MNGIINKMLTSSLAQSDFGKGHATKIIKQFRKYF